jgi:glycogen operon protein
MTYGYFAPDRRYSYDKAPGGPTKEFKAMVKAFHDAGIEVWMDVVYNHTGEGGCWDAARTVAELTSFRGLDNQAYYALVSTDKPLLGERWVRQQLQHRQSAASALVKDSLKYFITEMGVDGFRFDLAPVLGRDAAPNYSFNPNAALVTDIAAMTDAYNVEMIAEAGTWARTPSASSPTAGASGTAATATLPASSSRATSPGTTACRTLTPSTATTATSTIRAVRRSP